MAKKIKNFDRATAIAFGTELETALARLEKKYGISLQLKNRTFSGNDYRARVIATVVDSSGVAQSPEAQAYEQVASMYNFKVGLGETFKSRGTTYRTTGYNARRRRYPISATRVSDGANFKFPMTAVQ